MDIYYEFAKFVFKMRDFIYNFTNKLTREEDDGKIIKFILI